MSGSIVNTLGHRTLVTDRLPRPTRGLPTVQQLVVFVVLKATHTNYIMHLNQILKLQDLITHTTTVMLYKANNQKAMIERLLNKHGARQLSYVKNKHHPQRPRLPSITVRGIHVWNSLSSEITQLLRLQQFKKRFKLLLRSSYL